jgi:hypothetical protein
MKKIIYSFIFILIVSGVVYLHFFRNNENITINKLDETAKSYLDEVLPRIIANWTIEELNKQASPRLLEHLKQQPKFANELSKLNQLGKLRNYRGAEGYVKTVETINNRRTTLGYYKAVADYEKASIYLTIKLIWVDNQWRILEFKANTPVRLR